MALGRYFTVDHRRYLIIGASGRVGARLHAALGPRDAVATYCATPVTGAVYFDSNRMRLGEAVPLENAGFTHAFLLHGVTNMDACARDPEGTARINVDTMRGIIDELVGNRIVPVFASSDAVYDGSRGLLSEEDAVRPILTYGRQKLEIERALFERTREAIVVRLAKVVGTGDISSDMLEQWLDSIDAGREIACARDQVFTPIHVEDAVRALIDLARGGHNGLFNAGGPDVLSRLDLLTLLVHEAQAQAPRPARIVECNLADLPFAEARPLDASMNSEKLYGALGWRPIGMREACRRAVAAHYGARAALETARSVAGSA